MLKTLLGIVFLTTVFTLETGLPVLMTQLRELKTDGSASSESFKSLLELELKQGSQVDEVVSILKDLLDSLKNDQTTDDLDFVRRFTVLISEVESLERSLENLGAERTATNTFLQDVTNELKSLTETVNNLRAQLDILNGKEEEIRDSRGKELLDYQHRVQNNNKVLNALNEILSKLTKAVFDQQDKGAVLLEVQRSEIIKEIKRELGEYNPIAVMVELTTQFDVGTVTRIIEKLERIRDAVKESQVSEDAREQQAVQTFEVLISELSELREKLAADYDQSFQLQRRRINEKVNAERTVEMLTLDIATTQELLINTRNQKDQFEAAYQSRKGKRGNEIKLIQAAYDLVSNHADKLRKQ